MLFPFYLVVCQASGGPPLVFDHQMVMDSEAQILYVFGGRVVDGDWDTSKYSGLYSYNISTSKWKLLQVPSALGVDGTSGSIAIPPRCGEFIQDLGFRRILIYISRSLHGYRPHD